MCSKEVNKMAATAGTPIKTTSQRHFRGDRRQIRDSPAAARAVATDHTTAGQKLLELPVRESPAMLVADGDRLIVFLVREAELVPPVLAPLFGPGTKSAVTTIRVAAL